MGEVHEATQLDLGRRVALKLLRLPLTEKPELLGRFLREGETAARMRHPHIVDVTDVGELDGEPYLVMELLDGEDLRSLLGRVGRLSEVALVDLLLPILSAVCEVHRHGVIHRDLKPHNIFLCRTPQGTPFPKLLDFGTAKVVEGLTEGDVTRTASLVGTPSYMAPEQITRAGVVDERTDQYSLGVVLFQASTGRLPFEHEELYPLLHAIVSDRPPAPRVLQPDLSAAFEAAILRAMARRRRDRYPSLREMGRALLPLASPPVAAVWSHFFHEDPAASAPREAPPTGHAPSAHGVPYLSGSVTLDPSVGRLDRPSAPSRRGLPTVLAGGALIAAGLVAGQVFRSSPHAAPFSPPAVASPAPSALTPPLISNQPSATPPFSVASAAQATPGEGSTRGMGHPDTAASSGLYPTPPGVSPAEPRVASRKSSGSSSASASPRATVTGAVPPSSLLRGANGSPILE
jgi:serine/threonine-protein kinase